MQKPCCLQFGGTVLLFVIRECCYFTVFLDIVNIMVYVVSWSNDNYSCLQMLTACEDRTIEVLLCSSSGELAYSSFFDSIS